jgi:formate hydrogenlyase subunit 4
MTSLHAFAVLFMLCLFYLAHIVVVPLLLLGLLRKGKALLQGRQGSPVLQPFFDTWKLLRKGETLSETTTWVFQWAPLVVVSSVLAAALMTPWLSLPSPVSGDLVLLVYVLALAKFAAGLGALDSGSAFGAFAASREATVSLQTEPALLLSLAALAVDAHSSTLNVLLDPAVRSPLTLVVSLVTVAALALASLAELSRIPIDDPATHLELTMIHEALILENSGPNLALVEFGAGLKMALLFGLIARIAALPFGTLGPAAAYLLSLLFLLLTAGALVVVESVLVRLRWRRIPNILAFGVSLSALACLVVAVKG